MTAFIVQTWLPMCFDVGLKSCVLLVAASLLCCGMHRASAASRHWVWLCAIGVLLLLPFVGTMRSQRQITLRALPAVSFPQQPAPLHAPPLPAHAARDAEPPHSSLPPPPPSGVSSARSGRKASAAPPWPEVAFWVWLVGCSGHLLQTARATLAARRMIHRYQSATEGSLAEFVRRIGREMNSERAVMVRQSATLDGITVPFVWGMVRPSLCLPADVAHWPEPRRRAVLLHELAHVERNDWFCLMLGHIVCALYWFNPLVWAAVRRMRVECEHACDDRVLLAGVPAPEYAYHLLEVIRTMRQDPTQNASLHTAMTMAHNPRIEARLRAILSPTGDRRAAGRRFRSLSLLGAMGALLLCGLFKLATRAQAPAHQQQSAAQTLPTSPTELPLTYEASVEKSNAGFTWYTQVIYDHGKFREGIIFNRPTQTAPRDFEVYDGSQPEIVWGYNADAKNAVPQLDSIFRELGRVALRDGEEAIRRRYHLPSDYRIATGGAQSALQPKFGIMHWDLTDPRFTWQVVGTERIAGYECQVHIGHYQPMHPQALVSDDGKTVEGDCPRTQKVWVEPQRNLILRFEETAQPVNGVSFAGFDWKFVVTKLRFPERISARMFQLPAGITAIVPRLFASVRLPVGVIVKHATGKCAQIGFGLPERTSSLTTGHHTATQTPNQP